jgi:hypothetical protein
MPRITAKGKKPPMSTTAVRRTTRSAKAAEKDFVDSLDGIFARVLDKLAPEERARRLKNLRHYLESLENDAKRA